VPDEKLDYSPTTDPKIYLQSKKMDLESGWLGRVVGSSKNAPNNMAFLVLVLTFGAGFLSFSLPGDSAEFWKLIAPIITGRQ
jgi:hypothetical protein